MPAHRPCLLRNGMPSLCECFALHNFITLYKVRFVRGKGAFRNGAPAWIRKKFQNKKKANIKGKRMHLLLYSVPLLSKIRAFISSYTCSKMTQKKIVFWDFWFIIPQNLEKIHCLQRPIRIIREILKSVTIVRVPKSVHWEKVLVVVTYFFL